MMVSDLDPDRVIDLLKILISPDSSQDWRSKSGEELFVLL